MNYNTIKKIFPNENCINPKKIKYDSEGLWSISHPESAELLTSKIKIFEKTGLKINSILDATAGLGGNTFSFAANFNKFIACEIDNCRFEILRNNLECYNYKNIIAVNSDCIDFIKNTEESIDAIFFDPPWGGPNYKYEDNVEIKLSDFELNEICTLIYENTKCKLVIFKLPYNYDINSQFKKCKSIIKIKHIFKEGNISYLFILINSKIE